LQVSTQIFLRLGPDVGLEEGLGVAEAVGVDDDDGRIFLSLGRVRDPRRHVNMAKQFFFL
jgi:hypothetical protein